MKYAYVILPIFLLLGCNSQDKIPYANEDACKTIDNELTAQMHSIKKDDIESITLTETHRIDSAKMLVLEGYRKESFIDEFIETLKRTPRYFENSTPWFEPNLEIIVSFKNKTERRFTSYGTVIVDNNSKLQYQFYMGMLLDKWFAEQ
jgi:hypothetical protein